MSLELQLEMLDERGYVLLSGVLEPLRIALLRCAIDDLQPIHWDYQGQLEHYKCVFNRNPLWLPFLDLPPLITLAEAVLGADCHVIGQTAWRSHPGYPGMALHLDHLPMQLPDWLSAKGDFTQPAQILTAELYLSDIDHNRCAGLSQRCLAQRRSQSQPGSRARHAASALRQAHGRAEVLAVLELAFQPSGAGRGNAPAKALAGRT